MKEYNYPLDIDWSTEEIVVVMNMWQAVENIYEKGMKVEAFLSKYGEFKKVVKSIGDERKLGKEFEAVSGYSLYRAIQAAKKQETGFIQMKGV